RGARVPHSTPVEWDAADVNGSDRAIVAADDANRLIAVSHAAADLFGWDREELIGQRVVSIVPEAMREAHIAGFVRYLVSGERRILGAPVRVLALRRDGSTVPVVIRIEVAATAGSRRVFTATFTLPD
ncbi:MAG: PAS domain S-box protein, partial [Mycobacteriales bacterium]